MVCREIDAKIFPQFHAYFLCGGVHRGPHHNAAKGKSHYMYACIVSLKQCS